MQPLQQQDAQQQGIPALQGNLPPQGNPPQQVNPPQVQQPQQAWQPQHGHPAPQWIPPQVYQPQQAWQPQQGYQAPLGNEECISDRGETSPPKNSLIKNVRASWPRRPPPCVRQQADADFHLPYVSGRVFCKEPRLRDLWYDRLIRNSARFSLPWKKTREDGHTNYTLRWKRGKVSSGSTITLF